MKYLKQILLIILLCSSCASIAQTTTIWLVRHAEKDTKGGNDPDLSVAGKQRAAELANELQDLSIKAVFSTPYKRTTQTGEQVQKQFAIASVQTYSPGDLPKLVKQVLADYAGQNVLVVGHSNTIIPTAIAFGAVKPFDTLTDDDYDMLFKITINSNGKANLTIRYYGQTHHTTSIPAN